MSRFDYKQINLSRQNSQKEVRMMIKDISCSHEIEKCF